MGVSGSSKYMRADMGAEEGRRSAMQESTTQFRPSHGAELAPFLERWCTWCVHDSGGVAYDLPQCGSVIRLFSTVVPGSFSADWKIGDDGRPICAAFEPRKK